MEEDLMAAIVAAISVYVQEEEESKTEHNEYDNGAPRSDNPDFSPWRIFGRQRGVISRTNWRVNKASR